MSDRVQRFVDCQVFPVWTLDNPPVVDVLVTVAGDLLLVRRPSAVRVAHRIDMLVRVEPAGSPVGVSQGHLRPVRHRQGLTLDDRAQAACGHIDARVETIRLYFFRQK